MEDEVLFQITRAQLETGLRGFPVGYCTTSHADPQRGLLYVGRPIAELVDHEPEQVIFLLYYKREGSPAEVEAFAKELAKRGHCSEALLEQISLLPRQGSPMDLLSAALLLAGMVEGRGDYREDALDMIAKIPQIAAHVINHHAGWGKTPLSRPELGYMTNFSEMLRLPAEKREQLAPIFRFFNVLHYDHGGGNLSAFVGKAVASGLAGMHPSLAACMSALGGPLHGGANQAALAFVQEMERTLGKGLSEASVEEYVRNKLKNNELIFGFGHAALRVEDARATALYAVAERDYGEDPLVRAASLLRRVGTKVLKENPKIAMPYPNVDAISGVLLVAAGFPYPHYFPVLFGLARVVGVAIQIVYERCEARGGKGTPIVRPKYLYKEK